MKKYKYAVLSHMQILPKVLCTWRMIIRAKKIQNSLIKGNENKFNSTVFCKNWWERVCNWMQDLVNFSSKDATSPNQPWWQHLPNALNHKSSVQVFSKLIMIIHHVSFVISKRSVFNWSSSYTFFCFARLIFTVLYEDFNFFMLSQLQEILKEIYNYT